MYRAQFPYSAARGKCEEQRCHYSFDGSNTPALESVAAGAVLTKIPLRMDQDAPFLLRAFQVSASGLEIRLEDCDENPLLGPDATQALLSGPDSVLNPALWCQAGGAGVVPIESDEWGIFCPAGGVLLLYVTNPTVGAITTLVITLHGSKWYAGGNCS